VSLEALKERIRPWYLRNVWFPLFPSLKPPSFDAAWRYPHAPLGDAGPLIDARRDRVFDFLFLSMTDWHVRIQRPQFLAKALASMGHRCFFLNPHLGREFRRSSDISPQLARLDANIYELHVRLPREPVFHHRLLHEEEIGELVQAVSLLRRIAGISRFVQIVGFPVWRQLAEQVREMFGARLVYDCHDLLSGFSAMNEAIVAEEGLLTKDADLVICSAQRLVGHCLKAGADPQRCILIRNAAPPMQGTARRNPGTRKVVGYVGALEDWFDVQSLLTAAVALPDLRFVIAGRVESPHFRILRDVSNVELRGEIASAQVPEFLAQLDVALIPFLLNDLTRAADPIKLYEYLSAGLPVVSTRLPEIAQYQDYIHFYEEPAEMAPAIVSAAAGDDDGARDLRKRAVQGETWEHRARALLDHLTDTL
jgi:glycosyltransferase involved in cell wall biosynthesis